ncbi:MAG: hypothetical protein R3C99_22430 [Pirellulaceae bacterium]
MPDYIPGSDADFDGFTVNLTTTINANLADYGLDAADVETLSAAQDAWNSAFPAYSAAVSAADAALAAKNSARESLSTAVREVVRRIQANSSVTDAARAAIGVTVADTTKTPAAVPTTSPIGRVEQPNRLQHVIHFVDSATPTSKAKPAGIRGCQIWMKLGATPPASASELQYLATDTRTPYTVQFESSDANQTAHYWLRWENTRGQTGPWSPVVSATVTGLVESFIKLASRQS